VSGEEQGRLDATTTGAGTAPRGANDVTKQERTAARAALAQYYAGSVGESVLHVTPVVVTLPAPPVPPSPARLGLQREAAALRDEIDAAYWRFTRQARALPPSMQCPEAYERLAEINALLATGDTP